MWLLLAVVAFQAPARQISTGQLPALPLTQLDERQQSPDLDRHTVTVSVGEPSPLRDVLVMLIHGTPLGIVVDPGVSGTFIGELKNVTVRRALDTVLPPFGLDYDVDGTVVRVFKRQPETRFFDLNYSIASRVGTARVGGDSNGSDARVTTTAAADVFADIGASVKALLSDQATYSVDRKAGLLQVTDAPERLDRVAAYLDVVQDRVHRQVEIDARVLEFERSDESVNDAATRAVRVADVSAFLAALAARGKVTVLAEPRLLTLNNETTIVRAEEIGPAGEATTSAVTISVTPQAAEDGVITLSLSPLVRLPAEGGDERRVPAVLQQADTLARVADGETLVISGIGRDRESRERKSDGVRGGWFGRSTVVTKKRVELFVLLTPHIARASR